MTGQPSLNFDPPPCDHSKLAQFFDRCDRCNYRWEPPYLLRSVWPAALPDDWPTVGRREKQWRTREGKRVQVSVNVTAHELQVEYLRKLL